MAKYGNKKTTVDGVVFDSKREAENFIKLSAMQKCGLIRELRTQIPFDLAVGGILICRYIADFVYYDNQTQQTVVADAKGFRTREYVIKRKLMRAIHGVSILEL